MTTFYPCPSPNFDERGGHSLPNLIVIHYTGMKEGADALERLCDPAAKVSAHYFIDLQGKTYQLVDDHKRAWHAGVSSWQDERDINKISLGIELDNGGHDFGLPAFPQAQIDSLLNLLKILTGKYSIPKKRIIGHSDVAPLRKKDPGELFPWQLLHHHGFGLWMHNTPFHPPIESLTDIQQLLKAIGYDCPLNNELDPLTIAVIEAFQRHFTPQEITGKPSELLKHTLRCLKA